MLLYLCHILKLNNIIMLKIKICSLLLLLFTTWNCIDTKIDSVHNEYSNNTDEIIFVVQMDINEGKSIDDIETFSAFYTNTIDSNEPNSLGWGFYEFGDKVILIERYRDGDAMMQHGMNISEGGVLEEQFTMFNEHFSINKIDVYGNATDELKEFLEPFGLPIYFHVALAKFSR